MESCSTQMEAFTKEVGFITNERVEEVFVPLQMDRDTREILRKETFMDTDNWYGVMEAFMWENGREEKWMGWEWKFGPMVPCDMTGCGEEVSQFEQDKAIAVN